MKFFKIPFATILFSLFFSACTKRHGDDDRNNGIAGPLFTEARNVVQSNCALSGCHAGTSPQSGIDFNNDAQIVSQKSRIKVRAVDQAGTSSQMPLPPMAPLSAADQQKITDWITAGGELTN